ncbi:hypothetical protein LXA43DRAFT_98887 [Ganoderma leucocontextum]|nr:hypothetical protein LXA43DRAFT_98887 [Ganoderma leucocontextum]
MVATDAFNLNHMPLIGHLREHAGLWMMLSGSVASSCVRSVAGRTMLMAGEHSAQTQSPKQVALYMPSQRRSPTMFSPLFSFAFAPNFAVPMPTDDTPSPEHISAIQTAIPDVPITVLRPVFNPDLGTNTRLPNPGTARANTAPSIESPSGTPGWAQAHAHQTVLQQHFAFFDTDADGVVWPHGTFRRLGFEAVRA